MTMGSGEGGGRGEPGKLMIYAYFCSVKGNNFNSAGDEGNILAIKGM